MLIGIHLIIQILPQRRGHHAYRMSWETDVYIPLMHIVTQSSVTLSASSAIHRPSCYYLPDHPHTGVRIASTERECEISFPLFPASPLYKGNPPTSPHLKSEESCSHLQIFTPTRRDQQLWNSCHSSADFPPPQPTTKGHQHSTAGDCRATFPTNSAANWSTQAYTFL